MRKSITIFITSILIQFTCFSQNYIAAVLEDEFWGYIDEKGNYIVQPVYNAAKDFSSGIGLIKNLDEWFYVNKNGNIINTANDYIANYPFSEGLARAQRHNIWGYIGAEGDFVIKPQFIDAEDFKDGLAAVKRGSVWGFIDKVGDYFVEPQFLAVRNFNSDVAMVKTPTGWKYMNKQKEIFPQNNEYEAIKEFSNGMAAVRQGKFWGYVDPFGTLKIKPQFHDAEIFSNGFAAVKIGNLWGYINTNGEFIAEPQFEIAKEFSGDMALVRQDGQYFFINSAGEEVGKNSDYIIKYNFSEGLSKVIYQGKWGFIDKSGKIVIEAVYEKVEDFRNGYAAVLKDGKWGFINKKGEIVIECKYRKVGEFKKL